MNEHGDSSAGESTRPNKSALKRAHQALQRLAHEMLELAPGKLQQLPLDEELAQALDAARGMRKGARVRQIRYLGGLLAKRDSAALQEALADLQGTSRAATARLHRAERWRDRLLDEGDEALSALAGEYPQVDFHQLRLLVRNSLRERRLGKAPRHYRELYRYLHALDRELDPGDS